MFTRALSFLITAFVTLSVELFAPSTLGLAYTVETLDSVSARPVIVLVYNVPLTKTATGATLALALLVGVLVKASNVLTASLADMEILAWLITPVVPVVPAAPGANTKFAASVPLIAAFVIV